jgi:multisubunit Na+/H+ antiporter MnhB subunit
MDFITFPLIKESSSLHFALRLALGSVTVSCVLFWIWLREPGVAEEDGLMEWTQAVFLGLAWLCYFRRSRDPGAGVVEYAVFQGLALLNISFLARELDIDSWGNPAIAEPAQTLFRAALIALWLVFGRFLWANLKGLWQAVPDTIGRPMIIWAFFGCCFYLVSWPFEKELFPMSESSMKFTGQLAQVHACALLFLSSLTRLFVPDALGEVADFELSEH